MATQALIESMEKLLVLHELLLKSAAEKTEAIKNNDMQEISKLLREEQKHVTAIHVADNSRQQAAAVLMDGTDGTISDVLGKVDGSEREQLIFLQEKLTAVIDELKTANSLNQQLLKYSLQFVNMNLDILAPEPELPNYSKTQTGNEQLGSGRSMFDSKA